MSRVPSKDAGLNELAENGGPLQPSSNAVSKAVLSPLSTNRHQELRDKRGQYFIKGPLSFAWIGKNIPDPASRVVLVAKAFMDMSRSDECALSAKVWDCAGVADRYQRRRVLARLREIGGDFGIEDRVGRPSVLRKAR